MNLKYLSLGAIATVITLGGGALACTQSAPQPTEASPPTSVISSPVAPAPAPSVQIAGEMAGQMGKFVAAEHPTTGTARIVTENGDRFLVFDQAFMTDSGPDLFVLLHRESLPQDYDVQNYISLGRLQNVKGEQRYAIPVDADLTQFQSAVIWCRQFNATFGYAPFAAN